jgi:hypothetical protein
LIREKPTTSRWLAESAKADPGGSGALVATLTTAASWLDRLLGRAPHNGARGAPAPVGVD